jgi:ribonuclease D
MDEYRLIDEKEGVEELAESLRRDRVIAVDTEADSFFHYYDKLCLIQIAAKSGIFLVDPLSLPDKGLAPLEPIFASPEVRKVFHAADYDLYVLQRYGGGIRVRNIFDTMLSAQLLGYSAVGLSALVENHFDIKLSKDQQRTDWSRRPLRSVQLEYAASDVRYLVELASRLEKELRGKKRLVWAKEEFALLEEKVWPERQFDNEGYLRIKGAKKLTPRALAVLRELFLVREKRAREVDKPAFKVLGNGTLLELAQNPPTSRRALAHRKGVTELVRRRMGNEILEGVQRGLEGPEHPRRDPPRAAEALARRPLEGAGDGSGGALSQRRARADRLGQPEVDRGSRQAGLASGLAAGCPRRGGARGARARGRRRAIRGKAQQAGASRREDTTRAPAGKKAASQTKAQSVVDLGRGPSANPEAGGVPSADGSIRFEAHRSHSDGCARGAASAFSGPARRGGGPHPGRQACLPLA